MSRNQRILNALQGAPLWALFVAAMLLMASVGQAAELKQAKYVFFFIGDGMAQAQRSAAEYYLATERGLERPGIVKLAMNELPTHGVCTTHSLNSIITDSGAAGTALACGVKTYNGAIAYDGQKKPLKSMAFKAKEKGLKVGVVSSVSLDHATPACFYSRQVSRNNYYEIALDLAESGFDFFGGGGFKDPEGKKSKKEGEKPNALERIKTNGYQLAQSREAILGLKPGQGKVLAVNPILDQDKAMPYAVDVAEGKDVSLAEFTSKAIELLDNPKGFFLMVEGGKIDWACHANDALAAIKDTLAFDAAVAEALAFAKKHPDETLLVVTGDHECGGMSLGFAGTKYGNYYSYLKNQKESFLTFANRVNEYKKSHSPENAKLEDLLPAIKESFGLLMPTPEELEAMKSSPKPNEDNTSPADPYGMRLKEYEIKMAREAFARSMAGDKELASDPAEYLRYGGYEPLTVALTHILDQKAGVGWTTYAHTGMPVVTSAMGVGAEGFEGYYDNTELAQNLMRAMGVSLSTEWREKTEDGKRIAAQ